MTEAHQTIKMVVKRTGLSAHVIRIWEKRYGAVEPERTGTNRRLYSNDQIDRLNLLRQLTRNGHSIGQIAKLPAEKLRELGRESPGIEEQTERTAAAPPAHLDECIRAVRSLNSESLAESLKRAETELGSQGVLQRVVAPLAQTIGDLWREGVITAAHEHFASAVIRIFLGHAARPFAGTESDPVLVVATPAGQIHELGALLVAAAAANLGWRITYLGANLPAAEIAGAARQNRARAVALSLVYPDDDPRLESELTRLHDSLPGDVTILAGGRAMPAYRDVLEKIHALPILDLPHLFATLELLRKTTHKIKS
jgi:DNA-binding transcriptional MerR regulator/methylmalonyl-CoA mutase cobalamin-binding subunit